MSTAETRYTFGPFTVDPSSRILSVRGETIQLNGKAFDLLLIFVKSGGEAMSRDDLFECLWPGGTVEDANLSQNVYLIRRALEREGGDRYIETVPRFGYRFSAHVSETRKPRKPAAPVFNVRPAVALLALLIAAGGLRTYPLPQTLPAGAHEAYALGAYHLRLRTPVQLEYAQTYFEQTVRGAPNAASGYAGLAATYALKAEYDTDGSVKQRREVERAKLYRDAAFSRNAGDSDALAAAGFIAYRFDQDPDAADRLLESALRSDPNNAAAYHWHGVLDLVRGNVTAAVADIETAHRLEPTSEVFTRWLGRAYAYAGRAHEAIAMVNEAVRIVPDNSASPLILATAQEELGDLHGALRTLHSLVLRDRSEMPFVLPDEARLHAISGDRERRELIHDVDAAVARHAADPFEASLFYYTVGLRDRANALLRSTHEPFFAIGLQYNDPRYKRVIAYDFEQVRSMR